MFTFICRVGGETVTTDDEDQMVTEICDSGHDLYEAVNIKKCCGGHEECFDHCVTNEF